MSWKTVLSRCRTGLIWHLGLWMKTMTSLLFTVSLQRCECTRTALVFLAHSGKQGPELCSGYCQAVERLRQKPGRWPAPALQALRGGHASVSRQVRPSSAGRVLLLHFVPSCFTFFLFSMWQPCDLLSKKIGKYETLRPEFSRKWHHS